MAVAWTTGGHAVRMEAENDMNATRPTRNIPRSIGAVFAGLLTIVLLSIVTDLALHTAGVFPAEGEPMGTGLWLFAAFYRAVYGVIACALTARLAPVRPMTHAMVLGLIGMALGTVGTVATWNRGPGFGPHWYPISVALMPIPCAWLGAKLVGMRGQPAA